jgi:hypothetical protein
VTLDSDGVTFTAGESNPNRVKWDNGSYIGGSSSGLSFSSPGILRFFSGSGSDVQFDMNGGVFRVLSANEIRLSANEFFLFDLPTYGTPADVNPVVIVGWTLRQKTNGFHGSAECFGVDNIEVERGIVVGVTCSAPQPDLAALRQELADLRALIAQLTAQPQARNERK